MTKIEGLGDSDWAADTETRKSVGSGDLVIANCLMHCYCFGESVVAFSSAEAEFYADISVAQRGLQLKSIMDEIGYLLPLTILSDNTAARAIAKRLGSGRIRHIEVKYLGLQHVIKQGRLSVGKVGTYVNSSDTGTKHLDAKNLRRLCLLVFCGERQDIMQTIEQAAQVAIPNEGWTYGRTVATIQRMVLQMCS